MSTFAVKVERISAILPHSNADRLEVAQVLDWRCVVQKGAFKEGDLCVYFPIDSILPEPVETTIFGPDAKVKLSKSRVKTIKLRGEISQGLAVTKDLVRSIPRSSPAQGNLALLEGDDITSVLGVTKYEPPETPAQFQGAQVSKKQTNPHFAKYTDLENAKNYPGIFEDGEVVFISEKIHGTNFRAGLVPVVANTFWKRVKRFFGLLPAYEFVYGSRNVQMQHRFAGGKTWLQQNAQIKKNVYLEAVDNYGLRDKLDDGYVLYGEVYGDGVQKSYTYGCKAGERKLVIFDVMKDGVYLDLPHAKKYVESKGLEFVPVWVGGFSTDYARECTKGASQLAPVQTVREGVVIKPLCEAQCRIGRKVLKFISDEYLLKDQTDFH